MANQSAGDIPAVPAASVAAPEGCVRITVKDRRGSGVSMIYRFGEVLDRYLDAFADTMSEKQISPGAALSTIKKMVESKETDDDALKFISLGVLWIAAGGSRDTRGPMRGAIGDTIKSTGRAVLYAKEMPNGQWSFDVGREIGTNEQQPTAEGGISGRKDMSQAEDSAPNLPNAPPTDFAAMPGNVRITVDALNAELVSFNIPFETLLDGIKQFGEAVTEEGDYDTAMSNISAMIRSVNDVGKLSEKESLFVCSGLAWLATKDGNLELLERLMQATGRAVIHGNQWHDGQWNFVIGKETGPISETDETRKRRAELRRKQRASRRLKPH